MGCTLGALISEYCDVALSGMFLNLRQSVIPPNTNIYDFLTSYKTLLRCVKKREEHYRSGTVNSKTINLKFNLIRNFFEIFAKFLLFHF